MLFWASLTGYSILLNKVYCTDEYENFIILFFCTSATFVGAGAHACTRRANSLYVL